MLYEVTVSDSVPLQTKTKAGYCVRIKRDKQSEAIEFLIGTILPRKFDEDIRGPRQFELLCKFLDWKGPEFQDLLFKEYKEAHYELEKILQEVDDLDKRALPYGVVGKILDLFKFEEIMHFLTDVYKLKAPSVLKDVFDPQIQKDEEGTREQTFLKSDYIELAALVIIVKASYMVFGHYAYITEELHKDTNIISVLYQLYESNDNIMRFPSMVKLKAFVLKLYHNPKITQDQIYSRNIEKNISDSEMVDFILANIIFHKLAVSSVVQDTDEICLVNLLYKFVTNKLKAQGTVTTAIRGKTPMHSADDHGIQEKESWFESFRTNTDLKIGAVAEINFAVSSFDIILPQLSEKAVELINKPIKTAEREYTYRDIHSILKPTETSMYVYSDQSLLFNQIIFKGMLDPRLFNRVEATGMFNFLSLSFMYLWNLGFPKLAMLATAVPEESEMRVFNFNISTGKSRLSSEVLEKLYAVFPLFKITGKTPDDGEYLIKKEIDSFAGSFYNNIWKIILPEDIMKACDISDRILSIPEDIKLQIANFLLLNEEITYRQPKEVL